MPACRSVVLRHLAVVVLAALLAAPAHARVEQLPPPDKAHILDGSAALTVGRLHVNITNWGLIGSRYTELSTYGDAPSGQWPGGSGNEYLFAAGLWIGGVVNGARRVSTGQPEAELRPDDDPRATLYEAREGLLVRPPTPGAGGIPWYLPGGDDDGDGRLDEEALDGVDQDGDGRVDEDFGQVGTQMFDAVMRDDTPLAIQSYPDHQPLHVEVRQRAAAWQTSEQQDFISLSFHVTNIGTLDIRDVYLGFWVDADIGPRTDPDGGSNDLAGTFDGPTPTAARTTSPGPSTATCACRPATSSRCAAPTCVTPRPSTRCPAGSACNWSTTRPTRTASWRPTPSSCTARASSPAWA
jgi:hypothetical protein